MREFFILIITVLSPLDNKFDLPQTTTIAYATREACVAEGNALLEVLTGRTSVADAKAHCHVVWLDPQARNNV